MPEAESEARARRNAASRDAIEARATRIDREEQVDEGGGEQVTASGLIIPPRYARARDSGDVFVVEPERTLPGRRAAPGENRTITASAARIQLDDRKAVAAIRRRRQAWQSEAWDYTDEVTEVGSTLDFLAALMSKLRLFAAVRPDPKGPPVPVDDPDSGVIPDQASMAQQILDKLRSDEGGQGVIVGDIAYNFAVAGECYLHGHEDEETSEESWAVRSVDELTVQGDEFALRDFVGSNVVTPVPKTDLVIRLWQRHRRFSKMATSPMRRVLSACENLLLLDRDIRATSMSRLTNGFMLWPEGMSFGPPDPTQDGGDGEARKDPFLRDVEKAQITAVQEPGSASAFVPINVQGPEAALEKVRHVEIHRQLDEVLDKRMDGQVMRVARGMPLPVEVTTGLQETTYANAYQVKKSEWDSYGEPAAVLIVDAVTSGYYQWQLIENGMNVEDARRHFVWFDPSECISAPDPIDSVDKGLDEGLVKEETWRRLKGFPETDKPEDDEILRRLVLNVTRPDPSILGQMLQDSGLMPNLFIPAPAGGILKPDGTIDGGGSSGPPSTAAIAAAMMPWLAAVVADREAPIGARAEAARALTAAARTKKPTHDGAQLGRRLAEIDRTLRTRLRTACELALRRSLERAGNKVKTAARRDKAIAAAAAGVPAYMVAATVGRSVMEVLGLSDQQLVGDEAFAELARDFGAWVDVAYGQAIGELERAVGELDVGARAQLMNAANRSGQSATEWLADQMTKLATARLYDPAAQSATAGEVGLSASVPERIVRGAMAIAGGETPADEGSGQITQAGGGLGGIGTGPNIIGETGGVEAYEWVYGTAPRQPFEPHLALDGVVFTSFEDDVLTNDEGWPDAPYYFPGDHDSCVCDWTPTIVLPTEKEAPEE